MQKKYRLRNRSDFQKVYRFGKSMANRQFAVYYWKRDDGEPGPFRLGISVSKKIGNAVVRNRLRRLIKEIVRLHSDSIKQNYDFIIIVRKGALDLDFHGLKKSIAHVLRKSGLLQKSFKEKAE